MRRLDVPPLAGGLADAVRRSGGVLLILLHLATGLMIALAPSVNVVIPSSAIIHEHGAAYMAPMRYDLGRVYALPSDSVKALTGSRLKLYENGQELGPAHAPHDAIRDEGAGRFSHWGGWIRFSTSDGSDPRANGRVYSITSPASLHGAWPLALIALDVGLVIAFRRQVLSFLRSGLGRKFLLGCGVVVVAVVALAALGAFGPVIVEAQGPPKDAALVVGILGHALLACAVSLAAWGAGAGLLRTVFRDPRAPLGPILIPAFAVGLMALAVLVGTALVVPHGRIVAAGLWLACLLPLAGWRPRRSEVARAVTALSAILPPALLFGAWLGLLWHGPTATLAGLPAGDLSFYASSIWSLAARPYPFVDLGYDGAPVGSYFNMLFSGAGAIFAGVPGFDPFLFVAAGGAASYVLLSALMLHFYLRDRARRRADAFAVLVLVLSVVAAAGYPSGVVVSIPVVFVPALTMSVWWMVSRGPVTGMALFAMTSGLIGSVLTKVVTAGVLVPLGAAGLWPRLHRSPRFVRAIFFAIAGVFAVYSAFMLARFLPIYLEAAPLGPQSFLATRWEYLLRDFGMIIMAVLAWRMAEPPVAVAIILGLASAALFHWVFSINFVCATLVLGLMSFAYRERSNGERALMLLAFACPLPAVLLTDPTGTSTGVAWAICLGGAALIACATGVRIVGVRHRETSAAAWLLALVTAAGAAFGLMGVARGNIIVDSGAKLLTPALTPAVRDIWFAVRGQTPFDALIFTDQVADTPQGQTPLLLGGWNTYAFAGQRQVYVSNYYMVAELRFDAAKRREVLAVNDAVLRGAIAPSSVATRRHYGSFFAVVRRSAPVPPGWGEIYQNSEYALYSISPGRGS